MTFKRFLALLLVLCTLGSLVTPAAAQAAEDPQTTLESSNMAFTGTNSFGNLLAAEISALSAASASMLRHTPGIR